MMCQFQYQIGHCEIAMDTSMTSPLSARITNKGRNWFAQSAGLQRPALNSLRFSCLPAIGNPTFYAQHPHGRSSTPHGREIEGGSTAGLAIFASASKVVASFDARSNSRPHRTGAALLGRALPAECPRRPPLSTPGQRSGHLKVGRTANDDVRSFRQGGCPPGFAKLTLSSPVTTKIASPMEASVRSSHSADICGATMRRM